MFTATATATLARIGGQPTRERKLVKTSIDTAHIVDEHELAAIRAAAAEAAGKEPLPTKATWGDVNDWVRLLIDDAIRSDVAALRERAQRDGGAS